MLHVQAIRAAVERALSERPDAVFIGADVGAHGGAYRASSGLLASFGARRVLDMPRNASAVFGIARGLALAGRPVVCELAPEDAERAASALALDAARWLEQQQSLVDASWGVSAAASRRSSGPIGPIVLRLPVARGSDVEGTLAAFAGRARILVPSRPVDAWRAICAGMVADGMVTFVIEHEDLYRGQDPGAQLPDVDGIDEVRFPEAWREVRAGDDLVVLTWGAAVTAAARTADMLAREGYQVAVVDIVALDVGDVAARAAKLEELGARTGRVLIAVDTGVSAAERLAHAVTDAAFLSLEAPVRVVSVGRDSAALVAGARALLDY